uniref:Ig-like domain-containing protein n=1 Tax=Salvator merianae TaxID=96440 RepID=A0A8D0DLT1_SALMN
AIKGTLTQAASESSSPGQTVKISCSKGSGSLHSYGINWLQQKPGQAPRLLIHGNSNRATGVPDRFSGSASGDTGYLTISNLQAEDEAVDYCFAWYPTGSVLHSASFRWGTETKIFTFPL